MQKSAPGTTIRTNPNPNLNGRGFRQIRGTKRERKKNIYVLVLIQLRPDPTRRVTPFGTLLPPTASGAYATV